MKITFDYFAEASTFQLTFRGAISRLLVIATALFLTHSNA
jgi:hypothetical protein